jgi:hypothetical protein
MKMCEIGFLRETSVPGHAARTEHIRKPNIVIGKP